MAKMMRCAVGAAALAMLVGSDASASPAADGAKVAAAFGARNWMESPELSPDGRKLVFIAPGEGKSNAAVTLDLATGDSTPIMSAGGDPLKLSGCGWSSNNRIVCSLYGVTIAQGDRLSFTRLLAFDADGKHQLSLGRPQAENAMRLNQYDGAVIDWLKGDDGNVLMQRDVVPEQSTGSIIKSADRDGLAVERVNTVTGAARMIEQPNQEAAGYLTDGNGAVRIIALQARGSGEMLNGTKYYKYRLPGETGWRSFSAVSYDGAGLEPIAVDGTRNTAYALQKTDGRKALYRVALDGSMKTDLVYADPKVDVANVVRVGRGGRVIGLVYVTDHAITRYFDSDYEKLAGRLSASLPDHPLIRFVSTDADEQKIVVYAGSASDPGRYYLLDRPTLKMVEIAMEAPALADYSFGPVKAISYPAADGTMIPAYLTLPPGSDGRKLPALVMPHGGPEYRDLGGFDYLAQFFAQRGFAVIQPEFRGSAGFGEAFFEKNGFHAWRTAIGDVNEAGRWLVRQGIADPTRLAIFGWSYGGYAALQSNVLDPTLFKAVVAVAPVTDFEMLKEELLGFTDYELQQRRIGNEDPVGGSPDRHATLFQAPVLMFHGDRDINVRISELRAMDAALHRAGKQSRLVVYPGLDHQLEANAQRADMLAQSDAFLREKLGITP